MQLNVIDVPPRVAPAHDAEAEVAGGRGGARAGIPSRLRRALRRVAGERVAAVGFAGLLVVILRGDEVRGILTDLVRNALTVG